MAEIIYLERANTKLICHCKCAHSLVSTPSQMDCPWCGCGWLFTCIHCRKAYAFARGVVIDIPLADLAEQDLLGKYKARPTREQIDQWVEWMRLMMKSVQPEREYVYFDGSYFPSDSTTLEFEGIHARHNLPHVPQLAALRDLSVLGSTIGSPSYWQKRAITEE
jgi:hypothetical protein